MWVRVGLGWVVVCEELAQARVRFVGACTRIDPERVQAQDQARTQAQLKAQVPVQEQDQKQERI